MKFGDKVWFDLKAIEGGQGNAYVLGGCDGQLVVVDCDLDQILGWTIDPAHCHLLSNRNEAECQARRGAYLERFPNGLDPLPNEAAV